MSKKHYADRNLKFSPIWHRDADDKLIKQLIDHSYDEVMKKFTKKLRTEYDALP